MKTRLFLSVLALTAVLTSANTYADDAVATGETTVTDEVKAGESIDVKGAVKGVVKKTVGGVKKVVGGVKKAVPISESTAPTEGDGEGNDAVKDQQKPEQKTEQKGDQEVVAMKSSEDDSKDAEGNRTVSDTSMFVFSQNDYIQSIMESTTHIKSARLKELMARGDEVTMLDIRPRSEFAKVPGIKGVTLNIPRNFLEVEAYEKLPNKDASIIIVSTKGIRGGLAANTLQNMGYTNVRNLMDGLQGWNKTK